MPRTFENSSFEVVTKVDAARRQLATAIELFFEGADAVAIRTLVGAAHEILRTLVKRKGKGSILAENPLYTPELRAKVLKGIKRPYNFFKHADKDPDARIRFRPELTEALLFDAILMYQELDGPRLREANFFVPYFLLKHAEDLEGWPLADDLSRMKSEEGGEADKGAFLLLLRKARATEGKNGTDTYLA